MREKGEQGREGREKRGQGGEMHVGDRDRGV